MTINEARAAALTARQARTLDKLIRTPDGDIASWRERIERGDYAYRVARVYRDGARAYGLIEHADAAEALANAPAGGNTLYPGADHPLQALHWAPFTACPKLVHDYAEDLPAVIVTPDSFDVEHPITAEEWAHLTGAH